MSSSRRSVPLDGRNPALNAASGPRGSQQLPSCLQEHLPFALKIATEGVRQEQALYSPHMAQTPHGKGAAQFCRRKLDMAQKGTQVARESQRERWAVRAWGQGWTAETQTDREGWGPTVVAGPRVDGQLER